MRKYILLFYIILTSVCLNAQELDCRLMVNHSKLQGTTFDKLFQTFRQELTEFINNTNWTNHVYERDERIECNFSITIDEQISSDEFKGKLQITSSRPIYGTSYMSPIFNHVDNNFHFKYIEYETIEFSENTFTTNLASTIAFYVYIVLGMDYDSFGSYAGTPYFQKAERIVQNAQNAQETGWKAYESTKNRYWLVENLFNDQYSSMRDFTYTYHRQGLDQMADKPANAKTAIEQALEELKNLHKRKPGSFLMSIYTATKGDEVINIFSEAFPDEKARVYNIMKEIDPANTSKYEKIMQDPSAQ